MLPNYDKGGLSSFSASPAQKGRSTSCSSTALSKVSLSLAAEFMRPPPPQKKKKSCTFSSIGDYSKPKKCSLSSVLIRLVSVSQQGAVLQHQPLLESRLPAQPVQMPL